RPAATARRSAISAEMELPAYYLCGDIFRRLSGAGTELQRVRAESLGSYKNAQRLRAANEFVRGISGLNCPCERGAPGNCLEGERMANVCRKGGRTMARCWPERHDAHPARRGTVAGGGRAVASTRGALSCLDGPPLGCVSPSGGDLDGPGYSAPPWGERAYTTPGERTGEPQAPNPTGVPQGL